MKRFLSNLTYLQRSHPREAFFLAEMSSTNWEDEKEFSPFDEDPEILVVYGAGTGGLYRFLVPWLRAKRGRRLIFLEDQEEPLRNLLDQEEGGKLLRDKKVSLHLFHSVEEELHPFNELMWTLYGKKLSFYKHPSYSEETFERLKERLVFDQERMALFLQEYLTYGLRYYQNFYDNLASLPSSYDGEALFNQYKETPAIVVGAGPSLDKNGHLLKDIGGKGLIFGGGSSLLALLEKGITPHFAAAIDPNPSQAERMKRSKSYLGPLFYRLRLFPEALESMEGPKLYIPGSGGFDTAAWLEKELGIEGKEVEEGHNVVAFMVALAEKMGCNPIITVGLDLGFPEGKLYAQGVEEGEIGEGIIEKKDIYGKPLLTKWMWVQESEWLTRFQKEHPEVRLINATEGGLGAEGIENTSLKEALRLFFKNEKPIVPKLKPLNVKLSDVNRSIEKLQSSLELCKELLPQIDETPSGALKDQVLRDEPAYEAVLSIFDQILTFLKRKDRIVFLQTVVETQLFLIKKFLKLKI